MVSEAGAAQVIASYMEKSEMEELCQALPSAPVPSTPATSAPKTGAGAAGCCYLPPVNGTSCSIPALPESTISLMPRVLIEHQPLQKARGGPLDRAAANKPRCSASAATSLPQRSSRLRRLKSSYRRFLHLSDSTGSSLTGQQFSVIGAHPQVIAYIMIPQPCHLEL